MAEWNVIFSAIAAIGAAASAGCSLIQQLSVRNSAKETRRIENNTLWYNKIAMEIMERLNQTIDRAERNIEGCRRQGLKKQQLRDRLRLVNDELTCDINSVNELLFLLNMFDKRLFKECSEKLEEIRDIYSRVINKSLVEEWVCYYKVSDIHIKKKDLVGALLNHAMTVTEG